MTTFFGPFFAKYGIFRRIQRNLNDRIILPIFKFFLYLTKNSKRVKFTAFFPLKQGFTFHPYSAFFFSLNNSNKKPYANVFEIFNFYYKTLFWKYSISSDCCKFFLVMLFQIFASISLLKIKNIEL